MSGWTSYKPRKACFRLDTERWDNVLAGRSLSNQDRESTKLAVSAGAGCDYCEEAHNVLI